MWQAVWEPGLVKMTTDVDKIDTLVKEAVALLRNLISTPSFSNEEAGAADIWEAWMKCKKIGTLRRFHNNVYAVSENFDASKPILLLNSHLDTVKPAPSYTRDPFRPDIEEGILYGLGSNDAGASGVALAMAFLSFYNKCLPFNLLLAISASEEKMGEFGMRALLPHLKETGLYPSMAIVGEPTQCKAAIAERGLVVCDAEAKGVSGHAARREGVNAIYRAIEDIDIIRNFIFPIESEILGPIGLNVTIIEAGTQHNVVPDKCSYVIDMRTTDAYSNEETVKVLQEALKWSKLTPRSTRIRASVLKPTSPLFVAADLLNMEKYVSPTTSDMALMHEFDSIKIGPGDSARSHSADEYIKIEEIKQGIVTYIKFIETLARIYDKKPLK